MKHCHVYAKPMNAFIAIIAAPIAFAIIAGAIIAGLVYATE